MSASQNKADTLILNAALITNKMKKAVMIPAVSRTPRSLRYRRPVDPELLRQLESQTHRDSKILSSSPQQPIQVQDTNPDPVEFNKLSGSIPENQSYYGFRERSDKKSPIRANADPTKFIPIEGIAEYDHFIETGKVTDHNPQLPRPASKWKKNRLVAAPGELELSACLTQARNENDKTYHYVNQDKTDIISTDGTSKYSPTEPQNVQHTCLHTMTEFRRLLTKIQIQPIRPRIKKVATPNDASFSWIDKDLLVKVPVKTDVIVDGEDGKHLALTTRSSLAQYKDPRPTLPDEIIRDTVEGQLMKNHRKIKERESKAFDKRNENLIEKSRQIRRATRNTTKLNIDLVLPQEKEQVRESVWGEPPEIRSPSAPKLPTMKESSSPPSTGVEDGSKSSVGAGVRPIGDIKSIKFEDEDEMLLRASRNVTALSLSGTVPSMSHTKISNCLVTAKHINTMGALPSQSSPCRRTVSEKSADTNAGASIYSPAAASTDKEVKSTSTTSFAESSSVATPITPTCLKPRSFRRQTKSIAEILRKTVTPVKGQATMTGFYRYPIKRSLVTHPTPSTERCLTSPRIHVLMTSYVQESSMAQPGIPSEILATARQLPLWDKIVTNCEKVLTPVPRKIIQPRPHPSISSILQRSQASTSALPHRVGLPHSSVATARRSAGFIPPLLNAPSSNEQIQLRILKSVEIRRKRDMTITRYKSSMGKVGNEAEEDVLKARGNSRIGAQGRKRKEEVEEGSVNIATKKRKATATQKRERLTLLDVMPSRRYVDRVTNFAAVKDAWS